MALTRKVTFTLPTKLADSFNSKVRSLDRSAFVPEAIAEHMEVRRQRLIASCKAANASPENAALRNEMDALNGDGIEAYVPWDEPAHV